MNLQGYFPLALTGLISLLSKGLSKVFSSTSVQEHQFFDTQPPVVQKRDRIIFCITDVFPKGVICSSFFLHFMPNEHFIHSTRTMFRSSDRCPGTSILPKKVKVKVKSLYHVWSFANPWAVAYHGHPSMGFFRQEYWSGLPFLSPEDLKKIYFVLLSVLVVSLSSFYPSYIIYL